MITEGLKLQSVKSPGTAALICLAAAWLSVVADPAAGQESVTSPVAPAPLPKNMAPDEPADQEVAGQPYDVGQPLHDPSCEPAFRSCYVDDCAYCLEFWQGYCHEQRRCGHVCSPRQMLSSCFCWCQLRWVCWSRRCGSFIGLPRFRDARDTNCATCCGPGRRQQTTPAAGSDNLGNMHPSTNHESPAQTEPTAEPPKPVAPAPHESPSGAPRNELPQTPSATSANLSSESLAPEPTRLRVRSASLQGSRGTLRLIHHLQQAAAD
jgi:hypothetical protein